MKYQQQQYSRPRRRMERLKAGGGTHVGDFRLTPTMNQQGSRVLSIGEEGPSVSEPLMGFLLRY